MATLSTWLWYKGTKLSPYYQKQFEQQKLALDARKEALLLRLETAETPEERRLVGEKLAALPTTIRMM